MFHQSKTSKTPFFNRQKIKSTKQFFHLCLNKFLSHRHVDSACRLEKGIKKIRGKIYFLEYITRCPRYDVQSFVFVQ